MPRHNRAFWRSSASEVMDEPPTPADPRRLIAPGLYVLGLVALGCAEHARGFSPALFFLWGTACDLAGYALAASWAGWAFRRFAHRHSASPLWFSCAQAMLTGLTALLAGWIATDLAFEGMGEGVALLGLSGRMAACPAALMLVGTSIVMAWQTSGRWRARWQYAAMCCGVLFTVSAGWAGIEAAPLDPIQLWADRCLNLLISFSMMTFLTRFGLARFLPGSGDWIDRGRNAAPVFGGIALLAAVTVSGLFVYRWVATVV